MWKMNNIQKNPRRLMRKKIKNKGSEREKKN